MAVYPEKSEDNIMDDVQRTPPKNESQSIKPEKDTADAIRETHRDNDSHSLEAETKGVIFDDPDVQQFYGTSTTEAYRLKSELIGRCMEEIGMGRYAAPSFIVRQHH